MVRAVKALDSSQNPVPGSGASGSGSIGSSVEVVPGAGGSGVTPGVRVGDGLGRPPLSVGTSRLDGIVSQEMHRRTVGICLQQG